MGQLIPADIQKKERMYFYAIDGDDIGRELERLLLNNDVAGITNYSKRVDIALKMIANTLIEAEATIHFCAGDSVFASSEEPIHFDNISLSVDGIVFSMGIGSSPSTSFLALKKAKGLGKHRYETILKGCS